MLLALSRLYCALSIALLLAYWLWLWWGMTRDCWQRAHDCLHPVGEAMRLQCRHLPGCWTLAPESLRIALRVSLERVWHGHWLWLLPPAYLLLRALRYACHRLALRYER